jgi:hypothetical protein
MNGRNVWPQDIELAVQTADAEAVRPGCIAAFPVKVSVCFITINFTEGNEILFSIRLDGTHCLCIYFLNNSIDIIYRAVYPIIIFSNEYYF